jgi:type IV secretion system protein TrbL
MGCEWYNPASYGDCAGAVAKSVAGDAFNSIAQSFGLAADHAVNWLWSQLSAATAVHLGGAGFELELGITGAIAGTVAVGLLAIQVIQSVLRREPGGLARAAKGLLVAFIGGGAAIATVDLLLGATDSLCGGVVKLATGTDITGLGKLILAPTALSATIVGSAALLLLSLSCIAATVIVYVALVVRKVLIVVTAVFAPLAFAGSLADITVSWTRRWIETTVALIVSKLILVLIFVAGYGILIEGAGQSGSGATQKVTQVISGVLVLFLAGFAPWLALKVVHFTGDQAHQLHALGASAVGGVAAGGRMASKAAPHAQRLAAPGSGGGAAMSRSRPARATAAPSGPIATPGGAPGAAGEAGRPGGESGPSRGASAPSHAVSPGGAQSGAATSSSSASTPPNGAPSESSPRAARGAPTSPRETGGPLGSPPPAPSKPRSAP